MFIAYLHKVEGSIMLTIPPVLLDVLQLKVGSSVRLSVDAGRLLIEPQSGPRYSLKYLLAQCDSNAGNLSADEEWLGSKPMNKESI